jgi:hypothetical protein
LNLRVSCSPRPSGAPEPMVLSIGLSVDRGIMTPRSSAGSR